MDKIIKSTSSWQRLKLIFEQQVMVLEELVTDEESRKQVAFLRDTFLKEDVILKAIGLGLENAEIPILAVIPKNCMETKRQASFINFKGISGVTELSLNKVVDIDEKLPHHHPYWAFGISIGTETLNMPAKTAASEIFTRGRKPFTLAEDIALQIQYPSTMDIVSMNACGSCYGEKEGNVVKNVPAIFIHNGCPTVTWNNVNKNRSEGVLKPWASPSCLKRMSNFGVMTYIQCRYWRKRRERK